MSQIERALAAQTQPAVQVAKPLNDVQMVALLAGILMAGRTEYTPCEAVELACHITVEAAMQGGKLPALLAARKRGDGEAP